MRGRLLILAVLALHHAACAASALRASAISAAPEYPRQHSHSAALSPDIMPLPPSPAEDGSAPPPSDAVPTIQSSPSPPNPDALQPNSALAPYGYDAPAVAAPLRALPVELLLAMRTVWLVMYGSG
jgi:hypothetical protein